MLRSLVWTIARRLPGVWWAKSTTTKLVPSIVMTIPRRISVALIIMAVRLAPWGRCLHPFERRRLTEANLSDQTTCRQSTPGWPLGSPAPAVPGLDPRQDAAMDERRHDVIGDEPGVAEPGPALPGAVGPALGQLEERRRIEGDRQRAVQRVVEEDV